MNKVLQFDKNKFKSDEPLSIEELLIKLYNDRKLNNILHELIMATDKIIQLHNYEFKSEGDRDFVKDYTHKSFLSVLKNKIKEKQK